ncbi:CPBP family intramembrane metalloprotease [Rossellomorea aquimaris]|uniref:CPBP family intramembrane glutamic endopeptidase n=1 Tax=Rossellomorea aquimaris TaxID=189382 RepID=UPI001CD57EF6|nr:CPBP family intramembrane glutamic endopeptidase [Rossellomorea aquimaris]MCA1054679.1 CPBP family intramembrane metalloprotease [Rossellomorea aquimaris]
MKKQGDLINQLSKRQLTFHLFFTQIVLLTISFLLGIFLFEDWSTFGSQFRYTSSIWTVGVTVGLIVVMIDVFLMKKLPPRYYDDGGVNERIFSDRSIWEIALLAIAISLSEELLFRGVLQFHFGLIISSIVFAAIHFRYWAHWFLILNIVVLSFLIGIIYESTGNLVVTIVMHFIIDFLLGLYMRFKASQAKEEGMSNEQRPIS